MHFLLTNDDGIEAIGIQMLSQAVLRAGHRVTVAAPSAQQSATSHRITLANPLLIHKKPWQGVNAFAIEGTPADCVRLAPCLCDEKIDWVLSGINNGENAGCAVYYSGTVAAAREARMLNLKSLAVSIQQNASEKMLLALGAIAVSLAEYLETHPLPRFCFPNLNAPATDPKQWKELHLASLSDAFYLDSYERRINPYGTTYFWLESGSPIEKHKPGTDMALLQEGYVTCTFLSGYTDNNPSYGAIMQEMELNSCIFKNSGI